MLNKNVSSTQLIKNDPILQTRFGHLEVTRQLSARRRLLKEEWKSQKRAIRLDILFLLIAFAAIPLNGRGILGLSLGLQTSTADLPIYFLVEALIALVLLVATGLIHLMAGRNGFIVAKAQEAGARANT
ncbi:unnamed protein product [Didymodactylos carnosus]|uniref:Uncharacterized protein n=1 Tax=Didymodactylos carnosus TaxID=1234261 RepID=A0A8S2CRC7_9BILA|nr:unnamed protein product [Didymodactylos carnosus]CAF3565328.1 unnamed protein product [Didymodactylos carnosus]